MRIRFTTDPKLPRDLAHLGYRKDVEVDLSADQAERWLRRGVAVILPDAPAGLEPGERVLSPSDPAPSDAAQPVEPPADEATDEAADPAKPARSRGPRGK